MYVVRVLPIQVDYTPHSAFEHTGGLPITPVSSVSLSCPLLALYTAVPGPSVRSLTNTAGGGALSQAMLLHNEMASSLPTTPLGARLLETISEGRVLPICKAHVTL